MIDEELKIGRIAKVDGLKIFVEVPKDLELSQISLHWNYKDFPASIHRYVYSYLPNRSLVVCRITKVFERGTSQGEDLFHGKDGQYYFEALLTAIYDPSTKQLDSGINSFPIIGSEVYALENSLYQSFLSVSSDYSLRIGTSFLDSTLGVHGDPDVLFGKHLGIFGNTGTGKSCTVASIIQGVKRRLLDTKNDPVELTPQVIIFDANNEYSSAFQNTEFKVKLISKDELRLPHSCLDITEYYRLLRASHGVQAPVLKSAIESLRQTDPNFSFRNLINRITEIIDHEATEPDYKTKREEVNTFKKNQWMGYVSTMLYRIEQIAEDKRITQTIETSDNTVEDIIAANPDIEIFIIQADFDRDELDIIMFLFSKLLYQTALRNKAEKKVQNTLIVFEEAHRYIHEGDIEDYQLGNFYIERLAREGRKFGLSLIVSSQRPSELSRAVLSQCNSFIIHRVTNRNDLDFIHRTLTSNNTEILKVIPGLERQFAVAIGEAFNHPEIFRVETASPQPDSKDPEVINTWKSRSEQDEQKENSAIEAEGSSFNDLDDFPF